MPKISTSACFFNSAASRAAYMSPLASPAESRICVFGIEKEKSNRWRAEAAEKERPRPTHLEEWQVLVPCIEADRAGSRFRAGQAAPDALLVRAACLYGRREFYQRVGWCSGDAQ